ncbi:MAG: hypothetical protein KF729_09465 [Sandaracinaceae bacterium]|nr:hypothetical protein [Sandaracinaceae bacterium]
MIRHALALGLMLGLASGCDDGTPATDAGGTDAGGGGSDAGGGGSDAGGGGSDAGGGDEVERCRAASATLAAACPGDGQRTCHAGAYAGFCHADARPGLFADAIGCLTAMSGASGCRTFSDPSGASACIDAVYAGVTSAAIDAIAARGEAICPSSTPFNAAAAEPPFFALTPAQLATLQACLDAAADCDGARACAEATASPIADCYR